MKKTMRVNMVFLIPFCLGMVLPIKAQNPQLVRKEPMVREYITPVSIIWSSGTIINKESLVRQGDGQATLENGDYCVFQGTAGKQTGVLLDFGKERHGGIEIVAGRWQTNTPITLHIRFGESASEAMSDLGGESNATNDHAVRDLTMPLPWLGKLEYGNTGYRFIYVGLANETDTCIIKEINGISVYRDIPYIGSFACSDTVLTRIWSTCAYTVHLTMQNYVWDGIKRDRLVWVGDLHPEIMTIGAVFGHNEVVPKSLDAIENSYPLPTWMNGIPTYSMWWVIIQHDWYMQNGDLEYLKRHKEYMSGLLKLFCSKVDKKGNESLDGFRFIDWPGSTNQPGVNAGIKALLAITLDRGAFLMGVLDDTEMQKMCIRTAALLRKKPLPHNGSKQAGALMALAGMADVRKINDICIAKNGAENFSTFFGYYMLQAMAKAGDYATAMKIIQTYWGGMLKLGATTFWEDFDVAWMENAAKITEYPITGKVDVHATKGGFCYKNYRHSLCHGWASGPAPWLSEHVLGVQIVEPGCRKIRIEAHLGNLQWVEGTYPTPFGLVKIRHEKQSDGTVKSDVSGPKEVTILQ